MASAIMPKWLSRGNNSRTLGARLTVVAIDTRKSGDNTFVREVICPAANFLSDPGLWCHAWLRRQNTRAYMRRTITSAISNSWKSKSL
jgi:hypothetical protein